MIKFKMKGDLLKVFENNKQIDAIVQGCNCFHLMGAGLAKQIANELPMAVEADKRSAYGSKLKLGNYTKANCVSGTIINAYTQFKPGVENKTDLYENIKNVFTKLNQDFKDCLIAIPLIGCGIAGGEWSEVETIINSVTPDLRIIVVEYQPWLI